MERRLEIYNKIKNTKISKLTLKQGGEAKTLNLRVDLLNENVYLSDKALDMLENLAKRQLASIDSSIASQPTSTIQKDSLETNNQEIQQINESYYNNKPSVNGNNIKIENINNNFHETSDLPSNSQIEVKTNNEKLNNGKNEITTTTTATTSVTASITTVSPTTTNNTENYLCRLCLTKCPSERALHDHVTRIHGGSDSRRKHYLFQNNSNYSFYDDDDELNDTSDTNDETTAKVTPKSENAAKRLKNANLKLKIMQQKQKQKQQNRLINSSKPNVAIRVAKVAYYNNKNLPLNSTATNNSNKIFVNGIRGNFFSQERLPLKSCKIKLNINESTKQATNFCNKLTNMEINKFFRSLLVYIPNEILTIDDLIKPNNLNKDKVDFLNKIHSIILDSKECGINLLNLKQKSEIKSMNLLDDLLNILLKNFLILSVGVCERVYVAHEFCQPWIILSYKNQKGCNYASDRTTHSSNSSISILNQQDLINNSELLLKQKQYKKVWLIPRPWRYIDGLLNRQMLEKVFESIVLFLKMNPKVTFENISLHYSPVLQPIMTLELLEMLQQLNCVTCVRLRRECECNLESSFDHDSTYVLNNDDLVGNEISLYECNPNAIFILKQMFSNSD